MTAIDLTKVGCSPPPQPMTGLIDAQWEAIRDLVKLLGAKPIGAREPPYHDWQKREEILDRLVAARVALNAVANRVPLP
jgi:hypothetical protein